MKHLLFFICTLFSFTFLFSATPSASPEVILDCAATRPTHRLGVKWWAERLEQKEAQAKAQHDTVLIGDSITHNWDVVAPDLQKQYFGEVLNLGFSGDKTQDVLWRIQRIDWQVVAPKRIMLMIGTNNTGANPKGDPAETYNGIKAILNYLRAQCPQAKITLLAIFPRNVNSQDQRRVTNNAINAMLPTLADEEHIYLRDVTPFYLLPDGDTLNKALLPDWLHPNKEGHRLWAAAVSRDFMRDYK